MQKNKNSLCFWLLLTVHLSIFISVFNQIDAQNLFHNKFYLMPLHVSSTCAHHQEVKIALHSLWYHHTYRWPSRARDLETCRGMKWNLLWNKFCASSWLSTEINTVCVFHEVLLEWRIFIQGDSGGKVSIWGGDYIGHSEKICTNIYAILTGYRDRAVWMYKYNSIMNINKEREITYC